eukprot:m.203534 g.203534  ORF g.203534 m.203534 type:complete len:829 (-) comp32854_c0_seq3:137-2623(-)
MFAFVGVAFALTMVDVSQSSIVVDPWGENSIRVRMTLGTSPVLPALVGALEPGFSAQSKTIVAGQSLTNGNVQVGVAADGSIVVTRLSDNQILMQEIVADRGMMACDTTQEGCVTKASVTFSTLADQELIGTGQHMNTHGIPGRLPDGAGPGQPGVMLPALNMKGATWDFESCTVYSDSNGAEICLPWVIATTPPKLSAASTTSACTVLENTDVEDAVFVSNENIQTLRTTQDGCCTQCELIDACEVWIYAVAEPQLSSCWLMKSNNRTRIKTKASEVRNIGFKSSKGETPTYSTGKYEYGMLWNMPNFGRMQLNSTTTNWVAHDPVNQQIDFWITTFDANTTTAARSARSPSTNYKSDTHNTTTTTAADMSAQRQIMNNYVTAVGRVPMMPEWAAGYWHSPMGKRTFSQSEALTTMNSFVANGVPLPTIYVIDFFNWKFMGDYTFNPQYWPNPAEMVQNMSLLKDDNVNGTRIMVSAWPFIGLNSRAANTTDVVKNQVVALHPDGSGVMWPDSVCSQDCYLYDSSRQTARDFVFDMIDTGYVKYGIKNFWFDASEPESAASPTNPLGQPQGTTYSQGTNQQVGMMYPWFHCKMIYDGLIAKEPSETPVTLARSGWVGSWKFGASQWNGDLHATWVNLKKTVIAGLNAQLSGLGWWTHDIGAISGCDITSANYRELLVRWFQFGLTSPIFRQHGSRPVDPWVLKQYENRTFDAVVKMIKARYALRPYVLELMTELHETGAPVNRPLSFDFADDAAAWFITDQFMFGPKYMSAPITDYQLDQRNVYFPHGTQCPGGWKHYFTEKVYAANGQTEIVAVPYDELALFECMQ